MNISCQASRYAEYFDHNYSSCSCQSRFNLLWQRGIAGLIIGRFRHLGRRNWCCCGGLRFHGRDGPGASTGAQTARVSRVPLVQGDRGRINVPDRAVVATCSPRQSRGR